MYIFIKRIIKIYLIINIRPYVREQVRNITFQNLTKNNRNCCYSCITSHTCFSKKKLWDRFSDELLGITVQIKNYQKSLAVRNLSPFLILSYYNYQKVTSQQSSVSPLTSAEFNIFCCGTYIGGWGGSFNLAGSDQQGWVQICWS